MLGEELGQLAKDAGLIPGGQRHPDAVGSEQFGKQQA
jgi:hypothetical protein